MNGCRNKISKKEFVSFLMNFYDGYLHDADINLKKDLRLGQAFMITFDDVNYTGDVFDNINIKTDEKLFREEDELVSIATIVGKYLE